MRKHYKYMAVLIVIMSFLTSVTAFAFESEVSSNEPEFNPVLDWTDPDILLDGDNEPEEIAPEDPFKPVEDFIPVEPVTASANEPDPVDPEPDEENKNEPEDDPKDKEPENGSDKGNSYSIYVNTDGFDSFALYSVSADQVKFQYLDSISRNLVSINEVLNKYVKDKRDTKTELSGISSSDTGYQERVLAYLLQIAKCLSGNKAEALSMDEIRITVSFDQGVSEDMIEVVSENETESENKVSDNTADQTVSEDIISDNSVSKADIDRLHEDNITLHEDLRALFYVGLFGCLFLAFLTAGQLEQIIFKRLRG